MEIKKKQPVCTCGQILPPLAFGFMFCVFLCLSSLLLAVNILCLEFVWGPKYLISDSSCVSSSFYYQEGPLPKIKLNETFWFSWLVISQSFAPSSFSFVDRNGLNFSRHAFNSYLEIIIFNFHIKIISIYK